MTGRARRALITGLTGQDGSFLAELLLARGYGVTGLVRRPEAPLGAAEPLRAHIELVRGDLLAPDTLTAAVAGSRPDELYHLAAPSFVPDSWTRPAATIAAIAGATGTLLRAVAEESPSTRVFVAGSSEMFGEAPESPQREDTICHPRHPYGTAKLAAHQLVGQFRDHEGVFACTGILYNHESERRPENFVTRKITRAAAAIRLGQAETVTLGDLGAVRDWSFAGDVMRGAWLMLQGEAPRDYVLASGVGRTVRQLLETAFGSVGLEVEPHVRIDQSLVRTAEATPRVGDPARARSELGWRPEVSFEHLVERMVQADLTALAGDGPRNLDPA